MARSFSYVSLAAMVRGVRRASVVMCLLGSGCHRKSETNPSPPAATATRGVVARTSAAPPTAAAVSVPSASPGARWTPHELSDCSNAQLRACLAPFSKPRLISNDIRGLLEADCFKAGAETAPQAGDCLPLRAGVDARNGKALVFSFSCSDICPDRGSVGLLYEQVDEPKCCAIGGEPLHLWPDAYAGCMPPEYDSNMGAIQEGSDGKWRQIVGSRCPKRDPVIVAEWPCKPLPAKVRAGFGGKQRPGKIPYKKDARIHGDEDCPVAFDTVEAERALAAQDSEGHRCLRGPRPTGTSVTIVVAFTNDGKASPHVESPNMAHDSRVNCLRQVFERTRIAPFKGGTVEVLHDLAIDGT